MKSFTLRNLPEDLLKKIKELSLKERRSLNNEILVILEKGLGLYVSEQQKNNIYDFKDITGKLKWEGNAVTEQRKIRNEW